jgi:hypothetical protein
MGVSFTKNVPKKEVKINGDPGTKAQLKSRVDALRETFREIIGHLDNLDTIIDEIKCPEQFKEIEIDSIRLLSTMLADLERDVLGIDRRVKQVT